VGSWSYWHSREWICWFLANSTKQHIFTGLNLCPYLDLIPILRKAVFKLWHTEWSNLPIYYASKYKQLVPSITNMVWFIDLSLSRGSITKFCMLRINHNKLPNHSYKLGLNNSPSCLSLNCTEATCEFEHLVFQCLALSDERWHYKLLAHLFKSTCHTRIYCGLKIT